MLPNTPVSSGLFITLKTPEFIPKLRYLSWPLRQVDGIDKLGPLLRAKRCIYLLCRLRTGLDKQLCKCNKHEAALPRTTENQMSNSGINFWAKQCNKVLFSWYQTPESFGSYMNMHNGTLSYRSDGGKQENPHVFFLQNWLPLQPVVLLQWQCAHFSIQ